MALPMHLFRSWVACALLSAWIPPATAAAQPDADDDADTAAPVAPVPTTRPALEGPFAASHTYQFIQSRIVSRRANAEDLPGLKLVIHQPAEFERVRAALEMAVREPTPQRYLDVYSLFSRATPNPDVLLEYLDEALTRELERGAASPANATQYYAWPAASGLSALVDGYEATQDVRFLELFMRVYDRILAHRDSENRRRDEVRRRIMKSWGYRHRNRWTTVITHAGRIGYPVTRFCLVVRDDRNLRRQFNEKAQEYLNSIKAAMREFDEDFRVIEGTNEGYYIRRSIGDIEPLNHMHAVGNTLVLLHAITGREEYRTRVEQLANYYRGCIDRHENGTWSWGLQPTPDDRTEHDPEFVWKAEVTISFPITAMQYGLGFTSDELRPLVDTFLKNVWRGGEGHVFNTTIGPALTGELKPFEFLNWDLRTSSLLGWIRLDVLDPRVAEIIEEAMIHRTDLYPEGWLQNLKTAEIYAHRMKNRARTTNQRASRG